MNTPSSWFACEGEEATSYPNGYVGDPEACLHDRPWKEFKVERLAPRSGDGAKMELDRLWQGLPSVPKGGHRGPVRTRRRRATKAPYGEDHTSYPQGFRGCGDPTAKYAGE